MRKTTKDKIIAAATDVFGEKGYKAATVRDICKKAGVNQALVNYHFTSKKILYNEIYAQLIDGVATKYPVSDFVREGMDRHEKLRGLVTLMVSRAFGPDGIGSTKPRLKLLNREMIEPSEAIDIHLMKRVTEVKHTAAMVIREFLGSDAPEMEVSLCTLSIIGQCMFPMYTAEVMKKAGIMEEADKKFCNILIEHVYSFTLKALGE